MQKVNFMCKMSKKDMPKFIRLGKTQRTCRNAWHQPVDSKNGTNIMNVKAKTMTGDKLRISPPSGILLQALLNIVLKILNLTISKYCCRKAELMKWQTLLLKNKKNLILNVSFMEF